MFAHFYKLYYFDIAFVKCTDFPAKTFYNKRKRQAKHFESDKYNIDWKVINSNRWFLATEEITSRERGGGRERVKRNPLGPALVDR